MGRQINTVKGFVDKYCKQYNKAINSTLSYMADKVEEDFLRAAATIMDKYYNDYTKPPRKYERTNILKNDSYFGINGRTKKGYEAGIYFDSLLMNHPGESFVGESYILENFFEGIHGNKDIFMTEPSPLMYLSSYYDNYDQRLDKHYRDGAKLYFKNI